MNAMGTEKVGSLSGLEPVKHYRWGLSAVQGTTPSVSRSDISEASKGIFGHQVELSMPLTVNDDPQQSRERMMLSGAVA